MTYAIYMKNENGTTRVSKFFNTFEDACAEYKKFLYYQDRRNGIYFIDQR
jgi:hypothetical protein